MQILWDLPAAETTESNLQRQDTTLIFSPLISVDLWFKEQKDPKRQSRLCS